MRSCRNDVRQSIRLILQVPSPSPTISPGNFITPFRSINSQSKQAIIPRRWQRDVAHNLAVSPPSPEVLASPKSREPSVPPPSLRLEEFGAPGLGPRRARSFATGEQIHLLLHAAVAKIVSEAILPRGAYSARIYSSGRHLGAVAYPSSLEDKRHPPSAMAPPSPCNCQRPTRTQPGGCRPRSSVVATSLRAS